MVSIRIGVKGWVRIFIFRVFGLGIRSFGLVSFLGLILCSVNLRGLYFSIRDFLVGYLDFSGNQ